MSSSAPLSSVFVTVGNATQGFARLLSAVDALFPNGAGPAEVFVQAGSMKDYVPKNAAFTDFVSAAEFAARIQFAETVICHAGAGTLLHSIAAGKVPIVMPRLSRFNEAIDDHQLALARKLSEAGRIVGVFDEHELSEAIARGRQMAGSKSATQANALIEAISQDILKPCVAMRAADIFRRASSR